MTKGKLKRLTSKDYYHLEELIESQNQLNPKKLDVYNSSPDTSEIYKYRWLTGMKTYYLVGNDTHYLYGYFIDKKLISCIGWRCDLPEPYDKDWVVGHLKSRPGYFFSSNGIIELWKKMFSICEEKGLTRWHMLIVPDNKNRYQLIADRYFKEIDRTYSYKWTLKIPPQTQPKIDWIWGTMGRMLLNTELKLRTGTKKCVKK